MKFRLLENVFDSITRFDRFHYIYKNPTGAELSAKGESKDNRAVLDAKGNMYMESAWEKNWDGDSPIFSRLIHNNLLDQLHKKGIVKEMEIPEWYGGSFDYGVCIQRNGATKDFYIAESYDDNVLNFEENIDKIKKIFIKAKKKNPYCNFHLEFIYLA